MQGAIKLGMLVVAVTLATTTLTAMGFYQVAGVGFDTGMQQEVNESSGDIQEPGVFGAGGGGVGPSIFGLAVGAGKTFMAVFGLLLGGVYNALRSWGVSWPIAMSIQTMFDFAVGLSLLIIIRGFDFVLR